MLNVFISLCHCFEMALHFSIGGHFALVWPAGNPTIRGSNFSLCFASAARAPSVEEFHFSCAKVLQKGKKKKKKKKTKKEEERTQQLIIITTITHHEEC